MSLQGDTELVTEAETAYDSRPWVQHYSLGVPETIPLPDQSIPDVLQDIARRHGDNDAFVFQNYPMTFRQVLESSERMARALAGLGVGKGDVVLVLLPNIPSFAVAYYGVLRLGAALASVPANSVRREIEYFIEDSGAKTIITLDLLYENVAELWEPAGIKNVIVGKVTDFMPLHIRLAAPYLKRVPKPKRPVPYGGPVRGLREVLSQGRGRDIGDVAEPDDVALLQYTGGTTGRPKAAMLTHRNMLVNAEQMRRWFPHLREGTQTIMAILPFSHVYGVTLVLNAGLLLAARTVLIAGGWVPKEVFEAIGKYRPTIFPGVPTLYAAIINDERSRRYDLHSIDICVSGGAPLPLEVRKGFEEITGGRLYEGYGMTETSPVIAAQPFEGGKPTGIGLPMPSTDVRIVDADSGRAVPVGEPGEIVVRGPQVMTGYWRRPEETAEVLKDGWLKTGDIAFMDKDGWFTIIDRKKDLIITGGENIYPREVEEVLFEHPEVAEAAVVGVPHPFGGEIAKAFIVLKPGANATKKDITRFASERLVKYKVPRAVEFRSSLPKSPAGKVLRRVLGEEERARQESRPHRGRHNDAAEPGD